MGISEFIDDLFGEGKERLEKRLAGAEALIRGIGHGHSRDPQAACQRYLYKHNIPEEL